MLRLHKCGSRTRRRRGVAAAEFAVCLPILVLLVFASIEACSLIFLKQSLQAAAYESVRTAIRSSATTAEAVAKANAILDARFVNGASISFPAGDPTTAGRGDDVAVEITAPSGTNSALLGRWVPSRDITTRATMVKE